MPDDPGLAELLEEQRETPLGQITSEQAGAIVEQVLQRDRHRNAITVDVARFGSSI